MKNEEELKTLINLKELEKLQQDEDFDTRKITDAIDGVSGLCANWFGPDGIKERLSRLTEVTEEIINDDDFSSLEDENDRIYEIAIEVGTDLFEPLEHLENLCSILLKLEHLFPDDEEFDNEADEME